MKRVVKIMVVCMAFLVGGAFVIPAQSGALNSYAASKVKINKTKTTIVKGKTTQLKVTGTSKKATWKSSKKSVASVSTKGKVSAKKSGKATITAKVGSKKYKCIVTVKNPTTKLNKTSIKLAAGSTYKLKATSTGKSKKVAWKSSNSSIASVNSRGVVSGKKRGTVKITAKMNGVSKSCTVSVYVPVGTRTNPANLKNGATIAMPYGTAYVRLDKVLKGDPAISQLTDMGQWDSYAREDFADHPGTQILYLEYTVKAVKGFTSYPLEGSDIINPYGLYNGTCTSNINGLDCLYMRYAYESKDAVDLILYNGASSKMYRVLYVPTNLTSFSYPIWKSNYSDYWTKYTF